MARTKYPNDTSNICTTVMAVSRNPTGRTVHLARIRDSFGTSSCGNRTRIRHKKDERRSARRVRHRWISNRIAFVVGTSCRPSDTRTGKFEEKGKVAHGERARGMEGKFTCDEKERYEPVERAKTQEWIPIFQISNTFFSLSIVSKL